MLLVTAEVSLVNWEDQKSIHIKYSWVSRTNMKSSKPTIMNNVHVEFSVDGTQGR